MPLPLCLCAALTWTCWASSPAAAAVGPAGGTARCVARRRMMMRGAINHLAWHQVSLLPESMLYGHRPTQPSYSPSTHWSDAPDYRPSRPLVLCLSVRPACRTCGWSSACTTTPKPQRRPPPRRPPPPPPAPRPWPPRSLACPASWAFACSPSHGAWPTSALPLGSDRDVPAPPYYTYIPCT